MRITASQIVGEVAAKHGLTVSDLIGPSRKYRYTMPRFEAYFRCFTECPHLSYPEIGRRLGGRDHTTILHGVRRHCEFLGIDYSEAQGRRFAMDTPQMLARKWAEYEAVMREARAA